MKILQLYLSLYKSIAANVNYGWANWSHSIISPCSLRRCLSSALVIDDILAATTCSGGSE